MLYILYITLLRDLSLNLQQKFKFLRLRHCETPGS